MMLHSGFSISHIKECVAASFSTEANITPLSLKLVSMAGDNILNGASLFPYSWEH